jgi:Spy/CpxP family protein refolding chaperone
MKLRTFAVLAFTTLSASVLFAQRSGTPPTPAEMIANRVARLTTLLSLTTAQQAQATTIFTNQQTAESSLVSSMQAARTALKTAVQANDLTGIVTQATQIGSLTAQQVEIQAKAEAAFYAILTADQQTKYNQRPFGGPGGPRGGGGFGGPGPARFGGAR